MTELEQKVVDEALKKCFDPEIPVNIWELGLIYNVTVSPEGAAHVQMTSPGRCPARWRRRSRLSLASRTRRSSSSGIRPGTPT
jgi:hypothetical protein